MLLLPFAILPIFVALERIPRSLFEASADLGGSAWATFRRVVLPLSLPGALIGASFTFVLALGDFVTPQMVGGMSGITFGRIVYRQFGLAFNWPFGAALSVILAVVVLAVLWLAAVARPAARGRAMILPWYARLGLRVIVALALVILYGPLLLTVSSRSSRRTRRRATGTASASHWLRGPVPATAASSRRWATRCWSAPPPSPAASSSARCSPSGTTPSPAAPRAAAAGDRLPARSCCRRSSPACRC